MNLTVVQAASAICDRFFLNQSELAVYVVMIEEIHYRQSSGDSDCVDLEADRGRGRGRGSGRGRP